MTASLEHRGRVLVPSQLPPALKRTTGVVGSALESCGWGYYFHLG